MARYFLGFSALFLILAGPEPRSSQDSEQIPQVSITLPREIDSEEVQIHYFLIGPFGGYASYVPQRPGVSSYQVGAAVEGRAAESMRIVVYAPGCRFQTFVLAVSGTENREVRFLCQPLQTVRLNGRLSAELLKNENAELVVRYSAFWVNEFFGITDGIVTQLEVAKTKPAADGSFEMEIPDFAADAQIPFFSESSASLSLSLRDSKTLNPIVFNLEPELPEFRTQTNMLRIQSTYPMGLRFLPSPHN